MYECEDRSALVNMAKVVGKFAFGSMRILGMGTQSFD